MEMVSISLLLFYAILSLAAFHEWDFSPRAAVQRCITSLLNAPQTAFNTLLEGSPLFTQLIPIIRPSGQMRPIIELKIHMPSETPSIMSNRCNLDPDFASLQRFFRARIEHKQGEGPMVRVVREPPETITHTGGCDSFEVSDRDDQERVRVFVVVVSVEADGGVGELSLSHLHMVNVARCRCKSRRSLTVV